MEENIFNFTNNPKRYYISLTNLTSYFKVIIPVTRENVGKQVHWWHSLGNHLITHIKNNKIKPFNMFTILYILELPLLGLYIKEILKSVHKNLCPRLLFPAFTVLEKN